MLLTDGRSYPEPAAAAISAAHDARRTGVRIVALGIGLEVDARALLAIAGRAEQLHTVSRRDELQAAFRAVSAGMRCSLQAAW